MKLKGRSDLVFIVLIIVIVGVLLFVDFNNQDVGKRSMPLGTTYGTGGSSGNCKYDILAGRCLGSCPIGEECKPHNDHQFVWCECEYSSSGYYY